jgi:splicing factor 1
LGIPTNPTERSPSPEPIYSTDGKRLNTREVRVRKKLEDERHSLVQDMMTLNSDYKPPSDYKAPARRYEEKIFIPQDEHPEISFVGLIIGPRGHTLKQIEKETDTKIMIRGKGSVKENKLGKGAQPMPGEDEPLHALIIATTPEALKRGVDKIHSIIKSGIDSPGNDNDLKRQQLMQLAQLNGTMKPLDILNRWKYDAETQEIEQSIITNQVKCTKCGGIGHLATDCKVDITAAPVQPPQLSAVDRAKMDSEYQSLMAALGEKDESSTGGSSQIGNMVTQGVAVPPPSTLTQTTPGAGLLRTPRPPGAPLLGPPPMGYRIPFRPPMPMWPSMAQGVMPNRPFAPTAPGLRPPTSSVAASISVNLAPPIPPQQSTRGSLPVSTASLSAFTAPPPPPPPTQATLPAAGFGQFPPPPPPPDSTASAPPPPPPPPPS